MQQKISDFIQIVKYKNDELNKSNAQFVDYNLFKYSFIFSIAFCLIILIILLVVICLLCFDHKSLEVNLQ